MMLIKQGLVSERAYQKNIFEAAKNRNTLVVLPTGLGKTIIAALVIDYRLEKFKGSKALFLAPTKPLVNQHIKTFSGLAKADLFAASGSIKKEDRRIGYTSSQIVFATPQTVGNDIDSGIIDFSDFSVLVVDEAHHAIGNYSYVKIAQKYLATAKNPLVLGLTASPSSDKEKITAICRNLGITNVEIRNEDDPDVAPYLNRKQIIKVEVRLPPEILTLSSQMKSLINEQKEELAKYGFFKNTSSSINKIKILMLQKSLQRQMFTGHRNFYAIRGIIATSKLLKLYHAYDLLTTQSLAAFVNFIHKIMEGGKSKTDKELAKSEGLNQLYEKADSLLKSGAEHPKINKAAELIAENLKDDQKAIVFTQYRETVDILYKHLKTKEGIRPVRFIGQGRGGLLQREQIQIVKDFESGIYNVLVSTSVSEEGISIKGVDLAIFYDSVPSAIRSIQRRGRVGRFNISKIFLLVTEGTSDEAYYWVSKKKESKMKRIIENMKDNPQHLMQDGTLNPFV